MQILDRTQLRRVTEDLVALPTLPLVASQLLEAIADPDTRSEEVPRIVALDPALTARTLRLANCINCWRSLRSSPQAATSIISCRRL